MAHKGPEKPQRPRAITVGDKGRVTLPDDVRKHLKVDEGDALFVDLAEDGTARIIPATLVARDQRWFWHPEMQARVAEGLEQAFKGHGTPVRSAKELIVALRRARKVNRHD